MTVVAPRDLVPRLLLSVASQGLSSATNFALTVAVAVVADPDVLGRTVAVVGVYLLTLTLARSLVSEPLVATAGDGQAMIPWVWARGRILTLAAAGSAAAMVVGLAVGLDLAVLALLAAAMPLLLVQDGQRYLAWADGRPGRAVVLDGMWLVVTVSLAVAIDLGSDTAPSVVVAVWVVGGVASWALGRSIVERRPDASRPETGRAVGEGAAERLHRVRGLARSQAMMALAVNLGPVVLALGVSPAMAGTFKAVLIPFLPILSVAAGLRVMTLPALRRAAERSRAVELTQLLVAAGTLAAVAGGAGAVWLVRSLPPTVTGRSLAPVLPYLPWGIALCAMYIVGQLLADAVAIEARIDPVRRRIAAIGLEWGGVLTGAVVGGSAGLVAGWLIGLLGATAVWASAWLQSAGQ